MQGDTDAQCTLGVMYEHGQGVDQSYERAAEYFEAAALQGLSRAQYNPWNLGIFFGKGQGVEQSFETARKWWMKSAEQGEEPEKSKPSKDSNSLTKQKEEQHPPLHHPNDAPPATLPKHPPTN